MNLTNECGHPLSAEESVLVCRVCEAESLSEREALTWNAAIEAAAQQALRHTDVVSAADGIRALKREAK